MLQEAQRYQEEERSSSRLLCQTCIILWRVNFRLPSRFNDKRRGFGNRPTSKYAQWALQAAVRWLGLNAKTGLALKMPASDLFLRPPHFSRDPHTGPQSSDHIPPYTHPLYFLSMSRKVFSAHHLTVSNTVSAFLAAGGSPVVPFDPKG